MLTGAAALRSRLARKAVFSKTRYGQAGCVIAMGTNRQRARPRAHAAPPAPRAASNLRGVGSGVVL